MNNKVLRILSLLVATMMLITAVPSFAAAETVVSDNIALGKSVSGADGMSLNASFPYKNLTDGSTATRFASNGAMTGSLVIDLGEITTFNRVKVCEFVAGGVRRAQDYELLCSDDNKTWTSIYSGNQLGETPGGWEVMSFLPTSGRYIKFQIKTADQSATLYEIEVYSDYLSTNSSGDSDVENSKFAEDIAFLTRLGIMESPDGANLNPDEGVTKQEFAKILTKILALDIKTHNRDSSPIDFTEETERELHTPVFEDVPLANPYLEAIEVVSSFRLIDGVTPTKFYPEDKINYVQAVSTMVKVLCMDAMPVAAINSDIIDIVVKRYDLYEGLGYDIKKQISRAELAHLIVNTITLEYTDILVSANSKRGDTLLSKYHDIFKEEGVVEGNEYTQLVSQERNRDGYVTINSVEYFTEMQAVKDMLGYSIEYFYYDDLGERTIVFAELKKSKNDEAVIKAEDIVSSTATSVTYLVNNRSKNIRFSTNIDVIYNGNAAIESSAALVRALNISAGDLRFLDNNGDGTYDVLFVNEYQSFMVSDVDYNNGIIYDTNNTARCDLKLKDPSAVKYTIKNKNGTLKLKYIEKNSIVSVYSSLDGGVVTVTVGEDEVYGTLQNYNGGEHIAVIDDVEYPAESGISRAPIGSNVVAYQNMEGRIVYFDAAGVSVAYGYLWRIAKTNDENDSIIFTVLTEENSWETYTFNNRVRYNGTGRIDDDQLLQISSLYAAGRCIPQIIKYKLNGEGLCTEIETDTTVSYPTDNRKNEAIQAGRLIKTWDMQAKSKSSVFYNGNKVLYLDKDTVIFLVPQSGNKEDFRVVRNEKFYDRNYAVKAYNSLYQQNAEALVITVDSGFTTMDAGDPLFVFDKTRTKLDSYGDLVTVVFGYINGKLVEYTLSNENLFAGYQKGDLFQIGIDFDEKLSTATLIKRRSALESGNLSNYAPYGNVGAYNGVIFGKVTDINGDMVTLQLPNNDSVSYKLSSGTFYCYEYGVLSTSGMSNVQRGDAIAIRFKNVAIQEVVVYKF